jgi:hypothetical protein
VPAAAHKASTTSPSPRLRPIQGRGTLACSFAPPTSSHAAESGARTTCVNAVACGEGTRVGGTRSSTVLQFPHPVPPPRGGEGLRDRLRLRVEELSCVAAFHPSPLPASGPQAVRKRGEGVRARRPSTQRAERLACSRCQRARGRQAAPVVSLPRRGWRAPRRPDDRRSVARPKGGEDRGGLLQARIVLAAGRYGSGQSPAARPDEA